MTEVAPVYQPKFRRGIPKAHKASLDTRLAWLWEQRAGTVQMVWKHSPDALDNLAATLILQCILAEDLASIGDLLDRLEGGPVTDRELKAGYAAL